MNYLILFLQYTFTSVSISLYYSNPHGDPETQVDPGFKNPVIDLLYTTDGLTRDQAFLLPKGAIAYPMDTCYKSASSVSQNTESEYSSSLSRDCSVGISGGSGSVSGSFSLSMASTDFKNKVMHHHSERYVSQLLCRQRSACAYSLV